MARWLIQLSGDDFDVDEFPHWFPHGEPAHAFREDGKTYLTGARFDVLTDLSEVNEAEAVAAEVNELAGPDDVDAQVLWRSSLGRCRALQGRHDEAIALVSEAVALTEGVAAPLLRAQALTDCAVVLVAAGRHADAARDFATAIGLYESKGNRVAAEAVRQLAAAPITSSG